MKGLLLKDFYLITRYCRAFFLIDLVFFAVSFFNEGMSIFLAYPCILAGIIPMTLYSYDEREKWHIYSQTLPVSRKQIVSGKYITGLLSLLFTLILTAIVQAIQMSRAFDLAEYLSALAPLISVNLFGTMILMPLAFKFGVEKARIVYYITVGVMCGGMMLLSEGWGEVSISVGRNVVWLVLLAACVLYGISWLLSMALYERREL